MQFFGLLFAFRRKNTAFGGQPYINAHMSEKITNEQLAAVCGVSVQYFIRLFREHYHDTPQEYIMKWRVQKAKFALMQTSLSVDSIAESLGFCNASHFIRRFAEQTGKTPIVFRKANQHAAAPQI